MKYVYILLGMTTHRQVVLKCVFFMRGINPRLVVKWLVVGFIRKMPYNIMDEHYISWGVFFFLPLQKNIHIFTEFNFPQPTTHKKLWFARTSKERIYQISICYHNENSHILEFTCVNYLESDRHSHKDINMNRWGKNSFNSKLQKKKYI